MLKFKNDKERIAFLEDYRNEEHGWYLWKELDDIKRKWWRFDLAHCAFIVEEQLRTFMWPDEHTDWHVVHWYIVTDWHTPLADNVASRTMALTVLKEEEKRND